MKTKGKQCYQRELKRRWNTLYGTLEKGITLVALVVTMIVLLILAGVTISMATSGSGIFGRAKNAANVYRQAVKDENTALASYANEIGKAIEENNGKGKIPVTRTKSYVGYYADVNDDKTIDGIIYADMGVENNNSELWHYDQNSSYTIPTKTNLNNYYISQESYAGKFGTKPVISPIVKGSGNHDKDRFYVMALKDIDGSDDPDRQKRTYYDWYNSASNKLDPKYTSEDFGKGRENTQKMITKWNEGATKGSNGNYGGYGKQDNCGSIATGSNAHKDLWGQIQDKVTNGWFVPSRAEWSAFGVALQVTDDSSDTEHYYTNLGLGNYYWASSISSDIKAWCVYFDSNHIGVYMVASTNLVRLSTTF